MPDRRFLDRLHDDPPTVDPDLLPDEQRPGYAALLDACAAARRETVAPDAVARVRQRLAQPPARDRLVKAAWIATAAATAAIVLGGVFGFRGDEPAAAAHFAGEGDGAVAIRLTPDRGILVGPQKRPLTLDGLRAWIDGANRLEEVDGQQVSRLAAVIHAADDTPWQHLQWVMTALAQEKVYRVRLARAGGAPVPADLPTDRGVAETANEIKVQVTIWPGIVYGFGDQETRSLDDVDRWIRAARAAAEKGAPQARLIGEIKAAPEIPFGDVVRLLERYRAAGLEAVHFYGTRIPGPETTAAETLPPPTAWTRAPASGADIDALHRAARDAVLPNLPAALRALPKDAIAVLESDFDHPHALLDLYGIPHMRVTKDQLPAARPKLMVIGCTRAPRVQERDRLVAAVQAFVERGGWLLTTDWAAVPYLVDAFPGRVRRVQAKTRQPDTTVPVGGRGTSPLLEGVFLNNREARWWLEETSTLLEPGEGTETLLESPVLAKRYGGRAVAMAFSAGEGRVLHLVGHVYARDGNLEGVHAGHRLVINFLAARFARDR